VSVSVEPAPVSELMTPTAYGAPAVRFVLDAADATIGVTASMSASTAPIRIIDIVLRMNLPLQSVDALLVDFG
jgi:hypothetical protein